MTDEHLVEVTAIYKLGHVRMTPKLSVIGRNINAIEAIPDEVPESQDGGRARLQIAGVGGWVIVAEPYEEVVAAWKATLGSL